MPWSERQAAMLAEMGVRVWPARGLAGDAVAEVDRAADAAPAAVPARVPASAVPATAVADVAVPASAAAPANAAPAVAPAPPLHAAPRAASVDARALDWPALRAAVAGCTACPLCESRRQTVFGSGHPRAHWMVVGEAPGEQEDEQGEPFVGPSGRLLDNMLRAIGVARRPAAGGDSDGSDRDGGPARSAYIANTLKCRPPGNRNPSSDEMQRCEGFLVRQIELVQPKLILAMGQFAAQALLRSKEPVGRLRGRVHQYQGVPLVVTYHPAYLLRSPQEKARAWADLCLALETLQAAAAL